MVLALNQAYHVEFGMSAVCWFFPSRHSLDQQPHLHHPEGGSSEFRSNLGCNSTGGRDFVGCRLESPAFSQRPRVGHWTSEFFGLDLGMEMGGTSWGQGTSW